MQQKDGCHMRILKDYNKNYCEPNMTIDHIEPCAYDGTDCIENLWLLCGARNFSRGRGHKSSEKTKQRVALSSWLIN